VTDEQEPATDTTDATDAAEPAEPAAPRRRWLRRVLWSALALVVLGVGYFGLNLWLVYRTGESNQARRVDAIVVLGAAQYDGRPSPQLAARLDHVVTLWNKGLAPMVITTGGKRTGDRFTEAEASAKYLEAHGVPAAVIQQVQGATSYDELAAARNLLRLRGLHRVLLVSDPYHSLRIRLVSQELGLVAYVSPTPTTVVRGSRAFWLEVKEAAGVSVGRIIGFRRLLRITG
jgi:uncharacterized SAM-binding protein YcdF (DUF218 family)